MCVCYNKNFNTCFFIKKYDIIATLLIIIMGNNMTTSIAGNFKLHKEQTDQLLDKCSRRGFFSGKKLDELFTLQEEIQDKLNEVVAFSLCFEDMNDEAAIRSVRSLSSRCEAILKDIEHAVETKCTESSEAGSSEEEMDFLQVDTSNAHVIHAKRSQFDYRIDGASSPKQSCTSNAMLMLKTLYERDGRREMTSFDVQQALENGIQVDAITRLESRQSAEVYLEVEEVLKHGNIDLTPVQLRENISDDVWNMGNFLQMILSSDERANEVRLQGLLSPLENGDERIGGVIIKGSYSYMIFKDGDKYYFYDSHGTITKEGVACLIKYESFKDFYEGTKELFLDYIDVEGGSSLIGMGVNNISFYPLTLLESKEEEQRERFISSEDFLGANQQEEGLDVEGESSEKKEPEELANKHLEKQKVPVVLKSIIDSKEILKNPIKSSCSRISSIALFAISVVSAIAIYSFR